MTRLGLEARVVTVQLPEVGYAEWVIPSGRPILSISAASLCCRSPIRAPALLDCVPRQQRRCAMSAVIRRQCHVSSVSQSQERRERRRPKFIIVIIIIMFIVVIMFIMIITSVIVIEFRILIIVILFVTMMATHTAMRLYTSMLLRPAEEAYPHRGSL